ncbi:MAG: phage virion morphogenesis protein [Verrucomicrobia bacterium]|nr:phage virion morphogenesis protein [Verrucomicrobiota bacterium]
MSFFSFKVTKNDISPALSRMAASVKRPEPIFRAMGNNFLSLTMGNFKTSDYRPAPWPAKRDGTPSNLQKHGVLCKNFSLRVTSTGATLSSGVHAYAAIHQFGGTIKGKPWLRFEYAPGKWATVAQVTIPARPFFPVLNDHLTPKAEQKIQAAGERAMARQLGKP